MVTRFIKVQKYAGEQKEQAGPRCPGKGCCASQGVSSSRAGLQCQSAPRDTRPDVSSMTRACSSRWSSSLCWRSLASSLQAHTHAHRAHQGPELQHQPLSPHHPTQGSSSPAQSLRPSSLHSSPPSPLYRLLFVFSLHFLGFGKRSVFQVIQSLSWLFPASALPLLWSPFWLLLCMPHSSASHLASAAHALSERTCPGAISPPPTPFVGRPGGRGEALKNLIRLNLISGSVLWNLPQLISNCLL